jgi:opacity protein-like surface antigen
MIEQSFNKIKKTVFILLAVFFVVAVTAASASACASNDNKEETKEKPANVVDPKQAQEKLGNKLLDMVENNWFGNGNGGYSDNGWGGDSDNSWSDDDWFNGGW